MIVKYDYGPFDRKIRYENGPSEQNDLSNECDVFFKVVTRVKDQI